MQVPTKRIVADVTEANPHGYVVINESDFDDTVHEAWQPAPTKDSAGAREPVKPPASDPPPSKYGRK